MMASLQVKVKFWWALCEPDYGIVCRACQQEVFGKFRQLRVKIESLKEEAVPEWKMCPSCYDQLGVNSDGH